MECFNVRGRGRVVESRVEEHLLEAVMRRDPDALHALAVGGDGLAIDISEAAATLVVGVAGEAAHRLAAGVLRAGVGADGLAGGGRGARESADGRIARIVDGVAHEHPHLGAREAARQEPVDGSMRVLFSRVCTAQRCHGDPFVVVEHGAGRRRAPWSRLAAMRFTGRRRRRPLPRTPCCAGLLPRAVTVSAPRATGAAMDLMTTRAPSVCRGTLEGFETVTLSAGELEASFAPGLGMAGVSLRHGGEELLDRRAGLSAYAERGAVMGIPILHPWANRLSGFEYVADGRTVRLPDGPPLVRCEEHGLPIHGLLSGSPHWRVRARPTDRDRARLSATLAFDAQPDLLGAFPFPHTLTLDVALGA